MSQENRVPSAKKRVLTPEQKRLILKRRKMRRLKKRLMIIVPIAVVLIVALVLILTLGGGKDETAQDSVQAFAQQGGEATIDPAITPEPTPEPTPEAFDFDEAYGRAVLGEVTGPDVAYDYSDISADKRFSWSVATPGYIPVLRSANTSEKIIAVTVDDCFQGNNFLQILNLAMQYNSKLTIFPIGENIQIPEVTQGLQIAYQNGFEIGNHTYNHAGLFKNGQDLMAKEIWMQQQAVNKALGVNYKQNFFRPRGGDENKCQRLHAYLNQLDYKGVAMWNVSGSGSNIDAILDSLAPGNIYLFHTTDKDLAKLMEFIPYAVSQGYQLVTMSEMFGLSYGETSELNIVMDAPAPQAFAIKLDELVKPEYARAAAVVQDRLIELGWMEGISTGAYMAQSQLATGFFQMAAGLEATGNANEATQKALFADDAPRGSLEIVQQYCRDMGKEVLTKLPGTTEAD